MLDRGEFMPRRMIVSMGVLAVVVAVAVLLLLVTGLFIFLELRLRGESDALEGVA